MADEILDIKEIIGLINETNKSYETDIYVPSLNKEVHFKPLNTNHLKNIIKTGISGAFVNNQFNLIMYSILKDICDPSISLSKITTLDKVVILLQLRNKNIKNTLDIKLYNGGEEIDHKIKLDDLAEKSKKQKFQFKDEVIKNNDFEVTINFPSVEEEYQFENYLNQTKLKNVNEEDKNSMKALFGPIFVNELTLYIKSIKIKDKVIDLVSRKVEERLAIVEPILGVISTEIIEKINNIFGEQIQKAKTVSINKTTKINDISETKTYEGIIEIGPALFS